MVHLGVAGVVSELAEVAVEQHVVASVPLLRFGDGQTRALLVSLPTSPNDFV